MARKNTKRGYHHGDLASALVTEALAIIQSDGIGSVSLRELGRRLGVSQTAPYRHFADKEALLAALVKNGFQALTQAMSEELVKRHPKGSKQRLDALAFGYVHFAANEPGYFRLIFGRQAFTREHPELHSSGDAAFGMLRDAILAGQRDGTISGKNPDTRALVCWTAVHGFGSLLIDGLIDESRRDELLQDVLDRLHEGLRNRAK